MNSFGSGFDSVKTDVEQELSTKLGFNVQIESTKTLGGGCIHNASKLETNAGSFFLKWNADAQSDIFLREAESLRELKEAAKDQLIVPGVFAAREIDQSPGFLVLEMLDTGHTYNSDEVLGRGLATIHLYTSEKFGFYSNNYCGATTQDNSWKENWTDFFVQNRLGFLLNLIEKERPLPVRERNIYDKLLARIPDFLPYDVVPALIHGDLWSGNYMQTTKGPALIDPASYYAHCEMEMGIMTMFGGFSQRFYKAYNEINPLPEEWRERNKLYQLYHVLNHYYLFGGGYQNQALSIAQSYI
jgi:fructosamine-3-kinase